MPFVPAYGVTIPYQALNLDRVLTDAVTPVFGQKHDLVYVALSRVQSRAGLRFIGLPDYNWLHFRIPQDLAAENKHLHLLSDKFFHSLTNRPP